jgi:indolepyruvate ferredoxin oxidoreductase beta subunit
MTGGSAGGAAHGADSILKIAIMAVGGQGGGVLAGWIDRLARQQGYACQATSVAGVAQRTGATIYYIEMAPAGDAVPVFSLAPTAGDVDILIAAEMMEAGRAVMRGFVTPDKTTLIASTHRALAVSEKMVPGDGIAPAVEVRAVTELAARMLIMFDMESIALENGSVISSSLFGALAGSGCLPFGRAAFEDAIRAGGKSVDASLRAFAVAYGLASGEAEPPEEPAAALVSLDPQGPKRLMRPWAKLITRIETLPPPVAEMARHGLRKVVDFQDVAYGAAYLDRIERVLKHDHLDRGFILTCAAAKYIANAMAYDDLIWVADLKVRAGRFASIGQEMKITDRQTLHLTEFMHPRAEEIIGLLPASLGRWVDNSSPWTARLDRWFNKSRRVRSDRLSGFLLLHLLGGLRGYRLRTYRHATEVAHLESWLETVISHAPEHYDLAVELIKCRRLIKGYSDTHARGLSKFDRVIDGALMLAGRQDAADWVRRLRAAALADEDGSDLDGALETIQSFSET